MCAAIGWTCPSLALRVASAGCEALAQKEVRFAIQCVLLLWIAADISRTRVQSKLQPCKSASPKAYVLLSLSALSSLLLLYSQCVYAWICVGTPFLALALVHAHPDNRQYRLLAHVLGGASVLYCIFTCFQMSFQTDYEETTQTIPARNASSFIFIGFGHREPDVVIEASKFYLGLALIIFSIAVVIFMISTLMHSMSAFIIGIVAFITGFISGILGVLLVHGVHVDFAKAALALAMVVVVTVFFCLIGVALMYAELGPAHVPAPDNVFTPEFFWQSRPDLHAHPIESDYIEALRTSGCHVPVEVMCPITLEVMRDPVVADDGNTYELAAIQQHFFSSGPWSPLTREDMSQHLTRNRNVRAQIERLGKEALEKQDADRFGRDGKLVDDFADV